MRTKGTLTFLMLMVFCSGLVQAQTTRNLANHLVMCEPFTMSFEHPFDGEMKKREVKGLRGGKCLYEEEMPNNTRLVCRFSEELRKKAANAYRQGGNRPLQEIMDEADCDIEGGSNASATAEAESAPASREGVDALRTQSPGSKWEDFCVATADESFAYPTGSDDPRFLVREGQEFLVSSRSFGDLDVVALLEVGPVVFSLDQDAEAKLSFSCDPSSIGNSFNSKLVIMEDTTVYSDKALSEAACQLSQGTVAKGRSFRLDPANASTGMKDPYEVYQFKLSGAFSGNCDGLNSGYIKAPRAEIYGIWQSAVPVVYLWPQD
ncbi:hypothetical protein DES49_2420 [Halospina denitrificans]|uniref:Uncharacterized protein n=1 Tax=Halospina denitrificans TaxID=332522 RepID=A0A4R7JLS3_9GAMM|nr:hypothetical protein [Halospina denitrificans]TDT38446.1 hypothetical protein DES49_2420 [Halospina denitrificans]